MFKGLKTPVLILAIGFSLCLSAQTGKPANLPALFHSIPDHPRLYYFRNPSFKIPCSGHIQGIQAWTNTDNGKQYALLTGNSTKFSYYVTAQISPVKGGGKLETFRHLLEAPFRHAGGCQLSGDVFFTGIEDNLRKDKAKLAVVDIENNITAIIATRQGAYKRSTAGATGAVKSGLDSYLIIVGDWNSENFDCYSYREGAMFDSITTFRLPAPMKKCAYQSINLIKDSLGQIFMIGTGTDSKGNRADLFLLKKQGNLILPSLEETRYFHCKGGCSLRYGGGICLSASNNLVLYATSRRLSKNNVLNVFGEEK